MQMVQDLLDQLHLHHRAPSWHHNLAFLTMAYILAINTSILIDYGDTFFVSNSMCLSHVRSKVRGRLAIFTNFE
ncbi:putative adenine/guanine permease AZG1-like [Sesbania bispinosa]|nr:putative adenine/guanine permease AZG1-like [Sesbania bispinosa]